MKILLIILSIIGLLKLVSLFILICIEFVCKITKKDFLEIEKTYSIYNYNDFINLFPTISFAICGGYFEIWFQWFNIRYYAAYKIKYYSDES